MLLCCLVINLLVSYGCIIIVYDVIDFGYVSIGLATILICLAASDAEL